VVYDDFIQNFTADAWDPKEWVDLFADAGANYFVQVSKHHDGFALFTAGSDVSKRTAVDLGPQRNLLQVSHSFNDYRTRTDYLCARNFSTPQRSTSRIYIARHIILCLSGLTQTIKNTGSPRGPEVLIALYRIR
jgi:hypothetical protein